MKYLKLALILALFSCGEEASVKKDDDVVEIKIIKYDYKEMGLEITSLAQAELMKNVKSALMEGGPSHAIKFCNIHATPLTDSISEANNCRVSRISGKARNQKNKAVGREENILLNTYLETSLEGKKIKDTLVENDIMAIYYRPIIIGMKACLKCHGQKGDDISNETLATLSELYPDDKATNYRMGEFRGAWKVIFHKEEGPQY